MKSIDEMNDDELFEYLASPAFGMKCPFRSDKTLAELVNEKYAGKRKDYGDRYQNCVKPGPRKLEQFKEVIALRNTPALYSQEDKSADEAFATVKIFDPCGSWTWYITEFSDVAPDGVTNLAFGLVCGWEKELGYINLEELANTKGKLGIGLEIDMHWRPRSLSKCRGEGGED